MAPLQDGVAFEGFLCSLERLVGEMDEWLDLGLSLFGAASKTENLAFENDIIRSELRLTFSSSLLLIRYRTRFVDENISGRHSSSCTPCKIYRYGIFLAHEGCIQASTRVQLRPTGPSYPHTSRYQCPQPSVQASIYSPNVDSQQTGMILGS